MTIDCVVICVSLNAKRDNYESYRSITQFRRICNTIEFFTDANKCITFLTTTQWQHILLLIGDKFQKQILPDVQNISQINRIFILCNNQTQPMLELLKSSIEENQNNSVSTSILMPSSIDHNNKLNQSFMYSQLLKEIILDTDYDKQDKDQFIDYLRIQYSDCEQQCHQIEQFSLEYERYSPIWWYTKESFIYAILNKALRTQDTEIIIKMGFFIQDLHNEIELIQSQSTIQDLSIVYRGQGMLNTEFEHLRENKNGLLAFNNFLSTSIDEDVSKIFADSARENPDLTGVLFRIQIDSNNCSSSFASIEHLSYFSDIEKEILFSMHAVFRIKGLTQIDDRFWQVDLLFTNENDEQLTQLTEYMRTETQGTTGLHRLGQLMIKMGDFNKSQEIYETLQKSHSVMTGKNLHIFNIC